MAVAANERGKINHIRVQAKHGIGQRVFIEMPILEEFVASADLFDEGHIRVFVLEICQATSWPIKASSTASRSGWPVTTADLELRTFLNSLTGLLFHLRVSLTLQILSGP